DNRTSTLAPLVQDLFVIHFAFPDIKWPGSANLYVSLLGLATKSFFTGPVLLHDCHVTSIDSNLAGSSHSCEPFPLAENDGLSSKGIQFLGEGFRLDNEMARRLLADSSESAVVKPWLKGADLTDSHELPIRYAIDFGEMTLNEAMCYPKCF